MKDAGNLAWLALVLAVAVGFGAVFDAPAPFTRKDLARGLAKLRVAPPPLTPTATAADARARVLLGLNANLDAVVGDGPYFLQRLAGVAEAEAPRDAATVAAPADLAAVFAHHVASASAGERSVTNATLWGQMEQLVDEELTERLSLGGNAALMAEALARGFHHAVDVTLVGMVGPKIAGRLSSRVKVVPGRERTLSFQTGTGRSDFDAKFDQVHLILEYAAGTRWGSAKASRANRFIVSRDHSNGVLASLEAMRDVTQGSVFNKAHFDLVVVAGVHIMDAAPAEVRRARLQDVAAFVDGLAPSAASFVHVEMGSVGHADFFKDMVKSLLVGGRADSVGFNEQEFVAVLDAMGMFAGEGGPIPADARAALSSSVPPVLRVQEGIARLFKASAEGGGKRPLSRVHFHSFGYHLIALAPTGAAAGAGAGAGAGGAARQWKAPAAAVATGSLVATERACARKIDALHGNDIVLNVSGAKVDADEGVSLIEATPEAPVIEWTKGGVRFYLAPVLACASPKQTVGLGDYISASALAVQL